MCLLKRAQSHLSSLLRLFGFLTQASFPPSFLYQIDNVIHLRLVYWRRHLLTLRRVNYQFAFTSVFWSVRFSAFALRGFRQGFIFYFASSFNWWRVPTVPGSLKYHGLCRGGVQLANTLCLLRPVLIIYYCALFSNCLFKYLC